MSRKDLEVIFISAEVYPFSKIGGLGDVSGALPPALAKRGVTVKVITPAYKNLNYRECGIEKIPVTIELRTEMFTYNFCVSHWHNPASENHGVYFIENEELFGTRFPYTDEKGMPYPDNPIRFVAFQRAALALIDKLEWQPHIIHCNDHHTSLIPVYLKTKLKDKSCFGSAKSVLTLHNIAYQGIMEMEYKNVLELPENLFYPREPLEWYGQINPLKGGILFADEVTTVSPTHAKEIMEDEELSAGLKDVIACRQKAIIGILNGVDYNNWNPEKDPFISKNYSLTSFKDKFRNKKDLLNKIGLSAELVNRPLLGMVSRLVEQKGIPLLIKNLPEIIELGALVVVLGSGKQEYEWQLNKLQETYSHQMRFISGYNEKLAHQIIAGADFFLMPSRFEPCGMTQMYALRYGTIPIVHGVGGLADTVVNWEGERGTGIVFKPYTSKAFLDGIARAIKLFYSDNFYRICANAMQKDFSWENSAKEYHNLYKKLIRPHK